MARPLRKKQWQVSRLEGIRSTAGKAIVSGWVLEARKPKARQVFIFRNLAGQSVESRATSTPSFMPLAVET